MLLQPSRCVQGNYTQMLKLFPSEGWLPMLLQPLQYMREINAHMLLFPSEGWLQNLLQPLQYMLQVQLRVEYDEGNITQKLQLFS